MTRKQTASGIPPIRHGRACPGHPRLVCAVGTKNVDARIKSGHDGGGLAPLVRVSGPGAEAVGAWVYRFGGGAADGNAGMRALLGGKGANLAEMAAIGLPVPPGFTITTALCNSYYDAGRTLPSGLDAEIEAASPISRGSQARASATRTTRCSSPSARAPARRCPA